MRRTFVFDVSCPASTLPAAPVSADISIPPGWYVTEVQIVIPDGHAGLTGIAIAMAHGQVLPSNAGAFIEGNDETPRFPFTDEVGAGSWQALMFNGDLEPQPWQVRLNAELRVSAQIDTTTSAAAVADLTSGLTDLGASTSADTTPADTSAPPDLTAEPAPPDTSGDQGPPAALEPAPVDTGDQTPPDLTDQTPPDTSGDQTPPDLGEPVDLGVPPDQFPPDDQTGGPTPSTGRRFPSGGAPIRPGGRTVYVTQYRVEPVYATRTYPAGGWLPPGARFTVERIDQGQDFITDDNGPVIAPGDGRVISILSDRPFPDGFGPAYPVVEISTGRWAGRTYYVGHTTAAVRAGETFRQGTVLSHADQGHVSGGGWVELGLSSALGAGIHGQGAAIAGLFGPVEIRVQTGTRRVGIRVPVRVSTTSPGRKPPGTPHPPRGRKPAAGAPRPAPGRGVRRPTGGTAPTPPRRAPAPASHPAGGKPHPPAAAPHAAPHPAPAGRRAPAPPPPPPPRQEASPPPSPPRRAPERPPPRRGRR